MSCEVTHELTEFWERAHAWLASAPVRNSVLLTNLQGRRNGTVVDDVPAMWVTVLDEAGQIVGVAFRTPPAKLWLGELPVETIEPLVDSLLPHCPDTPGVLGTSDQAEVFARAWSARTGCGVEVEMRMRIHSLERVTPPARPAAGSARLARQDERDLLVAWSEAFVAEVEHNSPSSDAGPGVDARLAEDRAYVWDDGGPVCYVGISHNMAGVVRVGPVYTPPEHRGRGYASSLVAACSQGALDAGAKLCSLYTDLANPTSNKIYADLGYRGVSDTTIYRFI